MAQRDASFRTDLRVERAAIEGAYRDVLTTATRADASLSDPWRLRRAQALRGLEQLREGLAARGETPSAVALNRMDTNSRKPRSSPEEGFRNDAITSFT